MKVLDYSTKEMFKIIEGKAKFQKVMLLFDDEISNLEIAEIYNEIKDICVYNQCNVNSLDVNEIYNGYRAVIYMCSCESYSKLDFDKSEFINLCVVKNYDILPYCINSNLKMLTENIYIFCSHVGVDLNLQASFYFNHFYNYFNKVLKCDYSLNNMDFEKNIANIFSLQELVKEYIDFEFIDYDILKNTNIEYKKFWLVYLILIDAFIMFLTCVKSKNLMLVDIYKTCKEDYAALDKFYIMANNDATSLINLNYNNLLNLCMKTKNKILDCCGVVDISDEMIKFVIKELKEYTKNCNGSLCYLYLYDLLKV